MEESLTVVSSVKQEEIGLFWIFPNNSYYDCPKLTLFSNSALYLDFFEIVFVESHLKFVKDDHFFVFEENSHGSYWDIKPTLFSICLERIIKICSVIALNDRHSNVVNCLGFSRKNLVMPEME